MASRTRHVVLGALAGLACGAAVLLGPCARRSDAQLTLDFALTDKDVDKAMERLRNYLWTHQRDDGSWADVTGSHYDKKEGGTTALAVLALLESGVNLGDPRMQRALDALMAVEMDDLYCYSVRVMALSQAYRLAQRKEFAARIAHDLHWLTNGLPPAGAWGYRGPDRSGDNSCSQYALLALWEAMWAGFDQNRKIPPGTTVTSGKGEERKEVDVSQMWPLVVRNLSRSWRIIEKQWVTRQRADKGWTYGAVSTPDVSSTLTMTAAGVASLYIIIDEVYAPKMTPGKPRPSTKAFAAADDGMAWLAQRLPEDFTSDGYLAFGVQRIASASGHKYIGKHDWFRLGVTEIARRAASAHRELGGKHGTNVQAAFYLLFLARGRVPLTFNKLERPGTDWDCAPRDIANLTRHLVTKELEQRMAWQIVGVDRPVAEFLDAPALFISGIRPLKLSGDQVKKMREYVLRGGFIVGEATTSSYEFTTSFKEMMEQAFPEGKAPGSEMYTWKEMPRDHPILQGLRDRDLKQVGTIWAMNDPVRTIAVVLTRDHATAWQHRDAVKKNHCFLVGRNIFTYATAREPLRTRLRPVFAGRTSTADVKKKLGLMSLHQRWLSDEYAVERMSDKMAREAKLMVDPLQVADASQLDPKDCPMIWLTGRGACNPRAEVVNGLRDYIKKGGLVAINANMGDGVFARLAKNVAKRILPDAVPAPILEGDTVFTGLVYRERGKPIDASGVSQTLRLSGVRKVTLTGYREGDRWGVIVSPHDVFMSMLGAPIYGCKGYTGETAQQIAINLYLYALEQAEKAGGN